MGRQQSMILHDFYCIKCGNKGISIMRKQGHQREKFHRKKLYCPFCKNTINHIECKTMEDIEIFKQNFKEGLYINEAQESLSYLRTSW